MASLIKHPKDFWTGAMYAGLGAAAIFLPHDYAMGSALRMGPAYFPNVIGGLLILLGAIALFRSFVVVGEAITPFAWREVALVLGALALFGVLLEGAGLIVATVLLVLLGAWASIKFHWRSAALLAVGLTAFSALVFVKLLGVPLPILGSWFGQ